MFIDVVGTDLCVCPIIDLCVCPVTDLCVCPDDDHNTSNTRTIDDYWDDENKVATHAGDNGENRNVGCCILMGTHPSVSLHCGDDVLCGSGSQSDFESLRE